MSRRPTDRMLNIGVFSKRSRLSPKALRLYDRKGVLSPADVDPETGYRRYHEGQLATARLIGLLRRLHMPLPKVAEVIASPGSVAAELLDAYWSGVERRIASQRQLAAHLGDTLRGRPSGTRRPDVKERDVPEQLVLCERHHVTAVYLPQWIGEAMTRLLRLASRYGGASAAPFVVYHGEVNDDSDGPAEACVPIAAEGLGAGGPLRIEPTHREAYVRIRKAQVEFPQILSAYDDLTSWLLSRGLVPLGPPREVYFADFGAAGPHDEVCDVAIPIDDRRGSPV